MNFISRFFLRHYYEWKYLPILRDYKEPAIHIFLLEDVLPYIRHQSLEQRPQRKYSGFNIYMDSRALRALHILGTTCSICNRKGMFFALCVSKQNKQFSYYLRCFGIDKQSGIPFHLTRDHIVPRVLGGKTANNLQIACNDCNGRKGGIPPIQLLPKGTTINLTDLKFQLSGMQGKK